MQFMIIFQNFPSAFMEFYLLQQYFFCEVLKYILYAVSPWHAVFTGCQVVADTGKCPSVHRFVSRKCLKI